jgi:integrase
MKSGKRNERKGYAVAKQTTTGIRVRHSRKCGSRNGGCKCDSYEAWVWSARDGRKIRKVFAGKGAKSAAKSWRSDADVARRKGTLRAPSQVTIRAAGEAWLEGAKAGTIRTRGGDRYKPSAIRSYEQALRDRIYPDLGAHRLGDVQRVDVQDLVDRLLAEGRDPSTIRNSIMPLRVIYRRAIQRGEVAVNPTTGLELPAVRGKRDRIASPNEAASLLAALPDDDRALWATALFSGLRYGELAALTWEQVDLGAGLIRVERAWDPKAREYVSPKSHAGTRAVPIATVLREHLIAHKLRSGRSAGLVFPGASGGPFDSWAAQTRADKAWTKLARLTLHQARHTFASLMIAAGVNAKALSTYMGHGSITITLDRYGHLMPGNEEQAADLLDAYLAASVRNAATGG